MTRQHGCDDRWEQLLAYERGELTREQKADLERHLEACPACAGVLLMLYAVDDSLEASAAEAPPPEGLRDRILSATSRRATRAARASSWSRALPWVAGASGAAAALSLMALMGLRAPAGDPLPSSPLVRPMRADAAAAPPPSQPNTDTDQALTVRTAFLVTPIAAPSARLVMPGRTLSPARAARRTAAPAAVRSGAASGAAEPSGTRPRAARPPASDEAVRMLSELAGALRPLAASRPPEVEPTPSVAATQPPPTATDSAATAETPTFHLAAARMPADPNAIASLADLRRALRRGHQEGLASSQPSERWERGVVTVDFIRSRF
jgi:hypothetical protein